MLKIDATIHFWGDGNVVQSNEHTQKRGYVNFDFRTLSETPLDSVTCKDTTTQIEMLAEIREEIKALVESYKYKVNNTTGEVEIISHPNVSHPLLTLQK